MKDLDIGLRRDVLTLSGEVGSPQGASETSILRQHNTGRYVREFALSDSIDQSKIDAEFKDGVLRLTLPKAEKAVPRKIEVRTA